ncbi:MAG: exonuclease domain-containing protein [Ruminococcaceae bacterium]|nr:exonuclease domain-containing protein [Oscillospiraceae bacterium]
MKYIILDLEWNSAYYKPQGRFINEIIQIGAVELNENFEIIDTFQVYIKSQIVKKLSNRVISLTGITNERMNSGVGFREAVMRYNKWAGNDAVTMTWSTSDLYAIVENTRLFLDNSVKFNISKYLDLQSYIQGELKISGYAITNQISLINAAQLLGISTDGFELHNAKDDSYLCGLMLKKTYNSERFNKLIKNAEEKSFYERLFFRAYYISKINDERINKELLKFSCPQCKRTLKRDNKWKFKNNWLRCECFCKKCNTRYRAMLSFKQTYDKLITKRRILPIISENGVKNVGLQQLSEKM